MSRIEVLQAIHDHLRLRELPVMVLSTLFSPEDRERCDQIAAAVVEKSIDIHVFAQDLASHRNLLAPA
ncbi:MAG: hypothetical protein OHK0039_43230 [Bacteroidia bacterium]